MTGQSYIFHKQYKVIILKATQASYVTVEQMLSQVSKQNLKAGSTPKNATTTLDQLSASLILDYRFLKDKDHLLI